MLCWESSKTTLKLDDSVEGLTEPRRVVILTVTVQYSKGHRLKSVNGKSSWSKIRRQQIQASMCLLPGELHGDVLNSPSKEL